MAETLDVQTMIGGKFQPKLNNQFIFELEGVDVFLVKSVTVPSQTTEAKEIAWINTTRYIAGKTKWKEMSCTLHDPIAPSGMQQIMEWARLCYESVSGRAGYADMYKRDAALKMIDPVGNVISRWDIKGAFILDYAASELKYEDDNPSEITLSIRFDNAVLQY
jgi:hypothetical protein